MTTLPQAVIAHYWKNLSPGEASFYQRRTDTGRYILISTALGSTAVH